MLRLRASLLQPRNRSRLPSALRDVVLAGAPKVVHWATALILRRDRIHNPERALQWLTRDRKSRELDQIVFDAITRPTASENLYVAGLGLLFEHGFQDAEKSAKDNLALLNTTGGNDRRIACSTSALLRTRILSSATPFTRFRGTSCTGCRNAPQRSRLPSWTSWSASTPRTGGHEKPRGRHAKD